MTDLGGRASAQALPNSLVKQTWEHLIGLWMAVLMEGDGLEINVDPSVLIKYHEHPCFSQIESGDWKHLMWLFHYVRQVYQISREIQPNEPYPFGLSFTDLGWLFDLERVDYDREEVYGSNDTYKDLKIDVDYFIPDMKTETRKRSGYTLKLRNWVYLNYKDFFVCYHGVPEWVETRRLKDNKAA